MTPYYGSYSSTSCTEQGHLKVPKCLYYNYPFSSTLSGQFLNLSVIPVGPERKTRDSSFAMQASEKSFADIWNCHEEDIWDTL